MAESDSNDTLEITFSPVFAWMLIGFGIIFVILGVGFMTPLSPRQNILLGTGIVIAALSAILGGRVWLRNLPVVMRLKPEGLEIVKQGITLRWSDIDCVEIKTVYKKGNVTYLGIRLKSEAKGRYEIKPHELVAHVVLGPGFDLAFNDQQFSKPGDVLKAEIDKRILASN
jgi:hypothetical protein